MHQSHINWGTGYDLSYIEAIGTLFGLACVWYASQERRLNFYFGIINVSLFAIIFYQIQLYANLILQLVFLVMNIYGLFSWQKGAAVEDSLSIRYLTLRQLMTTTIIGLIAIVILTLSINQVFAALNQLMINILELWLPVSHEPLPADPATLLDSIITVLSLIAMILMTRKFVENWILWVIIDCLSTTLYIQQGVYFMAIEYAILSVIAANGARLWIISAAKAKQLPKN